MFDPSFLSIALRICVSRSLKEVHASCACMYVTFSANDLRSKTQLLVCEDASEMSLSLSPSANSHPSYHQRCVLLLTRTKRLLNLFRGTPGKKRSGNKMPPPSANIAPVSPANVLSQRAVGAQIPLPHGAGPLPRRTGPWQRHPRKSSHRRLGVIQILRDILRLGQRLGEHVRIHDGIQPAPLLLPPTLGESEQALLEPVRDRHGEHPPQLTRALPHHIRRLVFVIRRDVGMIRRARLPRGPDDVEHGVVHGPFPHPSPPFSIESDPDRYPVPSQSRRERSSPLPARRALSRDLILPLRIESQIDADILRLVRRLGQRHTSQQYLRGGIAAVSPGFQYRLDASAVLSPGQEYEIVRPSRPSVVVIYQIGQERVQFVRRQRHVDGIRFVPPHRFGEGIARTEYDVVPFPQCDEGLDYGGRCADPRR
mmetsp:Transcript_7881/g.23295  ORF Transcript_7881/g.23295 Transcript_7881/m.23295 type:complete len:425 (-) Transcript_7881:320-1594(-)